MNTPANVNGFSPLATGLFGKTSIVASAGNVAPFERYAGGIGRTESKPLGIAGQALDLFWRGLNVMPLPRAGDWNKRAKDGKAKKAAFPNWAVLHKRRLHLCGETCKHPALTPEAQFLNIFRHPFDGDSLSLGVVLGKTSLHLAHGDCETPEAFTKLKAEFTRREIPFVSYTSGRGGGLLFRVLEGDILTIPGGKCPFDADIEIRCIFPNGTPGYAALPPSKHPNGKTYTWDAVPSLTLPAGKFCEPVSIEKLDFLGVKLYTGSEPICPLPGANFLSRPNQYNVENGIVDGQGRNSKLDALTNDVWACIARAEMSESEGLAIVERYAGNCIPPLDWDAKVKSTWRASYNKRDTLKPARLYKSGGSVTSLPDGFIDGYDWQATFKGQAKSARKVFEVCAVLGKDGTPFEASVRYISDMALLNKETVCEILPKLVTAGLLRVASHGKNGAGIRYAFGGCCTEIRTNTPNPENLCTEIRTPKNDAAKRIAFSGLENTVLRIYDYLLETPAKSYGEIAQNLGMKHSTVSGCVRAMLPVSCERKPVKGLQGLSGLVCLTGEGYAAETFTDADWLQIAEARGKLQRRHAITERHENERAVFTNEQFVRGIFVYYGDRYFSRQGRRITSDERHELMRCQAANEFAQADTERQKRHATKP